jgi:ribosomal protein L11 methyltransferase
VAEENLRLNGLTGRVKLKLATITGNDRFDVIVANLQSGPLVAMAEPMAKSITNCGRLALSGILLEQKDQVRLAYEANGLRLKEERSAGDWCLLVFEAN